MKKELEVYVGSHVTISLKDSNSKKGKGMVKRILRKNNSEILVELLDGSMGLVEKVSPKMALAPYVKEVRDKLKERSIPKKIEEKKEEDIYSGESKNIEYKSSALWSQDLSKNELDSRNTFEIKQYGNRASKIIIARAITSFLNSDGGSVIIGIKETKEQGKSDLIIGIEGELKKLRNKDYREDGYKRMIIDEIIKPYFPQEIFNQFSKYFSITFPKKDGKTLCQIKVQKSDKEVFMNVDNKDHFFIKVDSETRELFGKNIIEYIRKTFK